MEKNSILGSAPINKVIIKTGLPMILSMMLQAVYNIVDSLFVSNMATGGEDALNALTLAFPMQMLMVAFAIGTGVGANAYISKALGRGDNEAADKAAGNAVFCGLVLYLVFMLFGLFGTEIYAKAQSENEEIVAMTQEYLGICCIISFGIIFFSVFEKLLQSTGRSLLSTIAQIIGAVINIVLDPMLIYGIGPIEAMGVKGAAIATVIGQLASLTAALVFHFTKNTDIKIRLTDIMPVPNVIKGIYSVGLPAIIAQAVMSVMTFGMNIILALIGTEYITAYGLFYKIQQFFLFASFGLRDAITPALSFAHGSGNRKRIIDGIKYGLIYTVGVMVIGAVLVMTLSVPLANMFSLSDETTAIFIGAMLIISPSFIFAGANIAMQGIYQALEGGLYSLITSLCRQLIFVLPTAYLFASICKTGAVWWSFIIAEGLTVIVGGLLLKKLCRNKIPPSEQG